MKKVKAKVNQDRVEMTPEQPQVSLNTNANQVEADGLEFEGKKILKVMHIVISDDKPAAYMCVNEDAEKVLVPAEIVKGSN